MAKTIQKTVDYARSIAKMIPLVDIGGNLNEPAITFANNTLKEMLSPPYAWKFNNVAMEIIPSFPYRIDYLFAGASALVPAKGGAGICLKTDSGITATGTTITVNTLQDHPFAVGDTVFMYGNSDDAYNSTMGTSAAGSFSYSNGWVITVVPSTKQFVFTHSLLGLGTSGAPGVFDFRWLASATRVDLNTTSALRGTVPMRPNKSLSPAFTSGCPSRICMLQDFGNGILQFRVDVAPIAPFGFYGVYQKKAPTKQSLGQDWSPVPDEFVDVCDQGFLAEAFRANNDPRAEFERQKFEQMIAKAVLLDAVEPVEKYIVPQRSIGGGASGNGWGRW